MRAMLTLERARPDLRAPIENIFFGTYVLQIHGERGLARALRVRHVPQPKRLDLPLRGSLGCRRGNAGVAGGRDISASSEFR